MLEAEATSLEHFEAIRREKLSLQIKTKQLGLQTEIAQAQTEELVYAEAESSQVGSSPLFSLVASSKVPPITEQANPLQASSSHQRHGPSEFTEAKPSH